MHNCLLSISNNSHVQDAEEPKEPTQLGTNLLTKEDNLQASVHDQRMTLLIN